MSSGGYKILNPKGIYFISFAVVEWVDAFSRREYKDILVESLRYCQVNKGLVLYGWVIMSNHVHFMASATNENLSDVLRDFKKFTSTEVIKAILENQQESRKDWMKEIFRKAGQENSRNTSYQFWRQDNQPKECFSFNFTKEKLDYIHNNPVVAGIVDNEADYIYSSTRDYVGRKGLLQVEFVY